MNLKKSLHAVCFSFLMGGFGLSAQQAYADKIMMPQDSWSIQKINNQAGVSACTLNAGYDQGAVLEFIAANRAIQALRVRLTSDGLPSLNEGAQVYLAFLEQEVFDVDFHIEDDRTLMIALNGATSLIRKLETSPILYLEIDGQKTGFSLTGLRGNLETLKACGRGALPRADLHASAFVASASETREPMSQRFSLGQKATGEPSWIINPFPYQRHAAPVQSGSAESRAAAKSENIDVVQRAEREVAPMASDRMASMEPIQLGRMQQDPYNIEPVKTAGNEAPIRFDLKNEGREVQEMTKSKPQSQYEEYASVDKSVILPTVEESAVSAVPQPKRDIGQNKPLSIAEAGTVSLPQDDDGIAWRVARQKAPVVRPVQIAPAEQSAISQPIPETILEQKEPQAQEIYVPQWSVQAGDSLREVLASWSVENNAELIWDANREYQIPMDGGFDESYAESVAQVLHMFSARRGNERPVGELFVDPETGKKVLIIKPEGRNFYSGL